MLSQSAGTRNNMTFENFKIAQQYFQYWFHIETKDYYDVLGSAAYAFNISLANFSSLSFILTYVSYRHCKPESCQFYLLHLLEAHDFSLSYVNLFLDIDHPLFIPASPLFPTIPCPSLQLRLCFKHYTMNTLLLMFN